MIDKFQQFIEREIGFNKKSPILLAISGGVDSVVLAHLFKTAGYTFGMAHCNFGLREKAADEDEQFVQKLAEDHGVQFFLTHFDTKSAAEKSGESIQTIARELRYEWFESIRKTNQFELIATAHHQDDNLETILFNLSRGTGLKGMRGILPKRDKIVRPLLPFSKEELLQYANENQLEWREDESNASTKYSRNFIRHEVIPGLKKLNPSILNNLFRNSNRLKEVESIYQSGLDVLIKKLIVNDGPEQYIPINKLIQTAGYQTVLFEILSPLGFNSIQVEQIVATLHGLSGKRFVSDSHQVIKDRKFLIVSPIGNENKTYHLIDIKQSKVETVDLQIEISLDTHSLPFEADAFKEYLPSNENVAKLQYNKLAFPLRLRKWKQGDYFYPFGMNQKKQKLSKYFTNQKFSLLDKEKVWILEDDRKRIVWVVGHRIDDRFAINRKTKKVYCLKISQN